MFSPKYRITDLLLANITKINHLVRDLNDRRFPKVVLMKFEQEAREVSAYASTSIEGNPLPLTEVRKLLKSQPHHIRDSEREVLNYNHALEQLNETQFLQTNSVSLELIKDIHRMVMAGLMPASEIGRFRKKPVVVNDPRLRKIVFLPPDWQEVEDLLHDLVDYVTINAGRIDPLILAGIFHKQMVVIHPFMDGNGRTTRLVTKVLLAKMGLNTFNLFSFENYYNQNISQYFKMVGEYGDYNDLKKSIDFTGWLEYFTSGLIDELLRVQKLLPVSSSPDTSLEKHHLALLEHVRVHGFITDGEYATLTDRAKATRTLDFQKLIEMELLERKGGGRSTYYILKSKV